MSALTTKSSVLAVTRQERRPAMWVSYWVAFSILIVSWDVGYCFLRPRSMPGGDLAWIWAPYNHVPYSLIDYLYGQPAIDANDGFTNAQALMNVIEIMLCVEYLYLRHTSSRSSKSAAGDRRPNYHAHAPLIGFRDESDDVIQDRAVLLARTWIVVPLIVTIYLGQFITNALMRDLASEIAYNEWSEEHSHSHSRSNGVNGVSTALKSGSSTPARRSARISRSAESDVDSSGKETYTHPSDSPAPLFHSLRPLPPPPLPFPNLVEAPALPLTFHPNGAKLLIIGSNRLAASRALTFLEADATVQIISPDPLISTHPEIQYRASQSQLSYSQVSAKVSSTSEWTSFIRESNASLVCVTDTMINTPSRRTPSSARHVHEACLTLRLPINISDHPALSTFTFPATHRFPGIDGPSHLQVAISTNGHGCRLTGRIRREIISKLPPNVGTAVDNVGRLRDRAKAMALPEDEDLPLNTPVPQMESPSIGLLDHAADTSRASRPMFSRQSTKRETSSDGRLRRMRWVHQMSEYYSYDALARLTESDMDAALESDPIAGESPSLPHHEGAIPPMPTISKGRIYLIGSGPGHPALLTVAALHILRTATVILSDKLVPSEVLALIPKTTEVHIARKFPGNAEGAQSELMQLALDAARKGDTVVRLKQGDPFMYGRGGEEVLFFRAHGYESTVIPGVSSTLAGPLMLGIPVTQRGVADSLVICTGVGRAGKSVVLPAYLRSRSLVILMAVARIAAIVRALVEHETRCPKYLPIAVIERASSPDQRVVLSTLEHVEEALRSVEERPPGMMLVGWAAMCLEGEGRVDILDREDEAGVDEAVVGEWLEGARWKVREGLGGAWEELMRAVEI